MDRSAAGPAEGRTPGAAGRGLSRGVADLALPPADAPRGGYRSLAPAPSPPAVAAARDPPMPADELLTGEPAALYLREISQHPLLTAEAEVTLAKQVEAGKAARERLDAGAGGPAEGERLKEAVRLGDAARRRLVESNLRLVVSVARRYLGRGLPFLDLVQEGNIGLQRGVEKYDWRRGFRLTTYAHWWIRQAVGRAAAQQGRTIRLPVHLGAQLSRLDNAAQELGHELGRAPTPDEIGARLGLEPEQVRAAFRAAEVPRSLERPTGPEREATLADSLADTASPTPTEAAERAELAETLAGALRDHLTPREVELLRLRFGLDRGGEGRTLDEVGQELGLSRERIRQLEVQIIQKLRMAVPFREQFQEYIG